MASEEPTPAAPPAEDAAPAQAADDKETADAAPATATDAPASKAKPASKKASSAKPPAKARASTGGAPKKGAAATDTGSKSFKVGETVLARLKGYPPWPARIADPESVPRGVASQRPGKGPQIYCVNYFPAGDFSWLNARDITKLSKDDISSFLSAGHRKASGGLKEAYETAADPEEWIAAQEELLRSREEDEREAAENVDELEDEDETPAGGKRKRGAASKPAQKKKAKKADADDAPKSKAKATKKSAAPASVPEDKAPADDGESISGKIAFHNQVKDWRHKLQRAFLGKGLPSATEMDQYNDVFNSIEAYKDMTIEALQYSKIGKVMKKIAALDAIPRNDELKITERAAKLMDDWHNFISGAAGGEKTNGDAPKSEAPKSAGKAAAPAEKKEDESKEANGASAEDEKKDDKMEVEAEA